MQHTKLNNVQHIIDHAERHCSARGSRLTSKRKQVLSGLLESGKALSAYELIEFCKEKYGEKIQGMSAYRILDYLQDEHLVHKLNLANKYVACTHIACDHEHDVPQFLICNKCQKVEEVSIHKSTIKKLQHNVERKGFHLLNSQFEMNCTCDQCMTGDN